MTKIWTVFFADFDYEPTSARMIAYRDGHVLELDAAAAQAARSAGKGRDPTEAELADILAANPAADAPAPIVAAAEAEPEAAPETAEPPADLAGA